MRRYIPIAGFEFIECRDGMLFPWTDNQGVKMSSFDSYKRWAAEQCCADCGAKASDRPRDADGRVTGEPWATETQCIECIRKLGWPEGRGRPSAKEIALSDGFVFG